MIDSKVVPFERGADFLRERGLKLKRSGQWLDALDLLRRAAETAPDAVAQRMELASVYADMGCHMDSRAMIVLHILSHPADTEAYYHLAKCDLEMGNLPEAEKALTLYLQQAPQGPRADEAREELEDVRTAYGMWKQIDRRTRRKVRHIREVRRRQMARDFAGAEEIYAREIEQNPGDLQMRANRAMNLCMQGDTDAVRRELMQIPAQGLVNTIPSLVMLVAQAYHRIGERATADGVLNMLDKNRMGVQDWLMLMALLADMGRNDQAYAAGLEALRQQPYDRRMLHLLAVTAARMGKGEKEIGSYWQRILRIDPEDDIAHWHLKQLREGLLTPDQLFDAYQLPPMEGLRRSRMLLELLERNEEQTRAAWDDEADMHRVLHWALFSEKHALVGPALQRLAYVGTPQCMRYIAEFLARTRMDEDMKVMAAQILTAIEPEKWQGVRDFMQMQLLPGFQEVLQSLPVGHRQMIRMAKEILELDFDLRADLAMALQCANYLDSVTQRSSRMLDLHAAAAALALIELRAAGREVDLNDLADKFHCSKRKLKYYWAYLSDMPVQEDMNHETV